MPILEGFHDNVGHDEVWTPGFHIDLRLPEGTTPQYLLSATGGAPTG
jgi:hypothetical protein